MLEAPKLSFDYRKVLARLSKHLLDNSVVVLSITILIVGLLVLQRINSHTSPSIDQTYLNKQITELTQVTFDEQAVKQIEELTGTSIEITSDFTDRNNPFEDN